MYSLDRSKQNKPSLLQSYFPRQTSFTTMQQFTTKLHSIPLLDRKTSPLVATFVSRSTSIAGIESLIVFTSNWKPFHSNQGAITHHVAWRSTTKKRIPWSKAWIQHCREPPPISCVDWHDERWLLAHQTTSKRMLYFSQNAINREEEHVRQILIVSVSEYFPFHKSYGFDCTSFVSYL